MLRKAWVFMRLVWPLVVRRSQTRSLLAMCAFGVFSASASADVVVVPYTGTFNEAASAPGGDYDNIGGLLDVGLFNLVAGNNTFIGAVHTPADSLISASLSGAMGFTIVAPPNDEPNRGRRSAGFDEAEEARISKRPRKQKGRRLSARAIC